MTMNQISTVVSPRPVAVLTPQTYGELIDFAERAASSDMVPRDYKGKPANIIIAVQMGAELGLQPMQALSSIAVINGRAGVWGDGMIGLCRQSPLCEDIREWIEGDDDSRTAHCEAKRRGSDSPIVGKFSVADAKRAGLWQTEARVKRRGRDGGTYETDNDSPWFRYPDRMLQNRARGFALRDAFPDLLRGLKTVEELRDYPEERPEPKPVQSTVVKPERSGQPETAAPSRGSPVRAAAGETLNGGGDPDGDATPPKPDLARNFANRFKQRMADVRDILTREGHDDALIEYNGIIKNQGVITNWNTIRDQRPELDAEMQADASMTLKLIVDSNELLPDAAAQQVEGSPTQPKHPMNRMSSGELDSTLGGDGWDDAKPAAGGK